MPEVGGRGAGRGEREPRSPEPGPVGASPRAPGGSGGVGGSAPAGSGLGASARSDGGGGALRVAPLSARPWATSRPGGRRLPGRELLPQGGQLSSETGGYLGDGKEL